MIASRWRVGPMRSSSAATISLSADSSSSSPLAVRFSWTARWSASTAERTRRPRATECLDRGTHGGLAKSQPRCHATRTLVTRLDGRQHSEVSKTQSSRSSFHDPGNPREGLHRRNGSRLRPRPRRLRASGGNGRDGAVATLLGGASGQRPRGHIGQSRKNSSMAEPFGLSAEGDGAGAWEQLSTRTRSAHRTASSRS